MREFPFFVYLIALAAGAILEVGLLAMGIRDASGPLDVLVVVGPAAVVFGLRHPTFVLPFYFFIGTVKNLPVLQAFPGNLSILMGLYVALCCLVHLVVDRRHSISAPGLSVFGVLVALILLAYGRSTMPLIAHEKLLYLATFVAVSFVSPMILVVDRRRLDELYWGFAAVGGLVGAAMFTATERGLYLDERMGMSGASAITTANAVVLGAVVSMFWWLPRTTSVLQRALAVGLALLCLIALIATGSRGPFLFGLLTLGVGALSHVRGLTRNFGTNVLRVALVGSCVGLALWGFRSSWLSDEFGGSERAFSIVGADWQRVVMANDRVWLMKGAVEMIGERPLLGHGLGGYQRFLSRGDEWDYTYPHNLLLDIGCEAGVPAALLLLALYVLAFWGTAGRVMRQQEGSGFDTGLLVTTLLLLFSFLEGMVSNDVFRARYEWGALGLALAVGVLVARERRTES